jgi:DNA invertase Pin-like site-specific DNA recombinase
MINDMEEGKIGIILCKDLSRFGRNNALVAYYTEIVFPDADIRFICVNDGIDSAKGDNEIMGFKSILNEYYARDISKKIRSSYRTLAQKGYYVGSSAPFRYKLNPNNRYQLLPDEETAPVVVEMFSMAADGASVKKIRKHLVARNILTPHAYRAKKYGTYLNAYNADFPTDWSEGTIQNILRNRVYCGHIISQKNTTKSFKNQKIVKRPKDEWIIVENTYIALVSEQDFDKVQGFAKTKHRDNKSSGNNIFAGIIKCFDCGHSLAYGSPPPGRNFARYVCNGYKRGRISHPCSPHYTSFPRLHEAVLEKVQMISAYVKSREGNYEEFYNSFLQNGNDLNNANRKQELEKLRKRGNELENIIRLLYEDRAQGIIPLDRFSSLFAGYDTEQKELNAKVDALQAQMNKETDHLQNAGYFLKAVNQFTEINELTASLLRELIEKIVIHESNGLRGNAREQRIDIHWRFIGLLQEATL